MGVTNKAIRDDGRIFALLGPTNTGKTHRAIERMLSYESGMITSPDHVLGERISDALFLFRKPRAVQLVGATGPITNPRFFHCALHDVGVSRQHSWRVSSASNSAVLRGLPARMHQQGDGDLAVEVEEHRAALGHLAAPLVDRRLDVGRRAVQVVGVLRRS